MWEAQGFRVQGIALSGIATDGLMKDAEIPSRTIDSYIVAKRSAANAWRELFESKKAANIDEKTFYAKMGPYAARYTEVRDRHAARILSDIGSHKAGLDYFKINVEELQPAAYKHHCRMQVENYLQEKMSLHVRK